MPDIFERKNVPRLIYCLHALRFAGIPSTIQYFLSCLQPRPLFFSPSFSFRFCPFCTSACCSTNWDWRPPLKTCTVLPNFQRRIWKLSAKKSKRPRCPCRPSKISANPQPNRLPWRHHPSALAEHALFPLERNNCCPSSLDHTNCLLVADAITPFAFAAGHPSVMLSIGPLIWIRARPRSTVSTRLQSQHLHTSGCGGLVHESNSASSCK